MRFSRNSSTVSSPAGDTFEQFDYLLQLSAQLEELPEERKVKEVLVEGASLRCGSIPHGRAWRQARASLLKVTATRSWCCGVIYLFQQMFSGQDARAIIECPVRFVEETELVYIFDAKRRRAFLQSRRLSRILRARRFLNKEEPHHG